ncbi:hypothetical protein PHYPSEUDO_005779 [Phytophthora pseudosyringae]|uniref:DUF7726 domain-containing protein n=1 Tax=Phytophthora pseudosyringae TaxID=221518 RepID=A0A8T1VKI7_9STRA|nr:hypothetical protein PHYPSEUDO_005779 [Phytophthora pseudosyringae]
MDSNSIAAMLRETATSMDTPYVSPIPTFNPPVPMANDAPAANITTIPTAPSAAVDAQEDFSDDGFDSQDLKYNCNQIRVRIRKFLVTKEMTLKDFLKECRVNPGPYYRFMDLNGPDRGAGNSTYLGASQFFYRRERRAKMDKKNQKASDKKRQAVGNERRRRRSQRPDWICFNVFKTLNWKTRVNAAVPRCMTTAQEDQRVLGEKIVTQAAFLKALGNVSANSLRSFMSMKRGAGSGAANVVYRKGYVFFEKKRIMEGGKKTKKRLENEAKQGPDGFELRHDDGKRYYLVSEL